MGRVVCLSLLAVVLSTNASAENDPPLYSSSASLGFGVEERSSTGFDRVGGSLFFLDVGRDIGDGFALGLRTAGLGGRSDGMSFQRMAAGPLLSWRPAEAWRLSATLAYFKESAAGREGDTVYVSEGNAALFGWEHVVPVIGGAEFSFGGFLSTHSGSVNMAAAIAPGDRERVDHARRNEGLTQGIVIGWRMPLR